MKSNSPLQQISDYCVGKAGEFFVCYDLLKKGYKAIKVDGYYPYDVLMEHNNNLLKIQVKTTREPFEFHLQDLNQRFYSFGVSYTKGGIARQYSSNVVDLFALVTLDKNNVGYIVKGDEDLRMIFLPEEDREKVDAEKIYKNLTTVNQRHWGTDKMFSKDKPFLTNWTLEEALHKIEQRRKI